MFVCLNIDDDEESLLTAFVQLVRGNNIKKKQVKKVYKLNKI